MATHSSTLAWKIPWVEEPGRLKSMGVVKSQRLLSDFTFTFHFHALEKETATHSSILAWRIPGMGEPGRLPSMGWHRVGQDWSDKERKDRLTEEKHTYLFNFFFFTFIGVFRWKIKTWKSHLSPKLICLFTQKTINGGAWSRGSKLWDSD